MSGKKEQYKGMSLRHERVQNAKLPRIKIFCFSDDIARAEKVSYGIEEEGLPYEIVVCENPGEMALEDTKKEGLGVAVALNSLDVALYCRQFKEEKELLLLQNPAEDDLRRAGQNGARIIKHRPLIWRETE